MCHIVILVWTWKDSRSYLETCNIWQQSCRAYIYVWVCQTKSFREIRWCYFNFIPFLKIHSEIVDSPIPVKIRNSLTYPDESVDYSTSFKKFRWCFVAVYHNTEGTKRKFHKCTFSTRLEITQTRPIFLAQCVQGEECVRFEAELWLLLSHILEPTSKISTKERNFFASILLLNKVQSLCPPRGNYCEMMHT